MKKMPYEFIEHQADVGIRAWGKTLEEAFIEGAKALFDIMVDIKKVERKDSVDIECEARDIPMLFVEWLNELIAKADLNGMVFCDFKISEITPVDDNVHRLKAKAFGEKLDRNKHSIKVEAKAATYFGLKYENKGGNFYLQCVIDL